MQTKELTFTIEMYGKQKCHIASDIYFKMKQILFQAMVTQTKELSFTIEMHGKQSHMASDNYFKMKQILLRAIRRYGLLRSNT